MLANNCRNFGQKRTCRRNNFQGGGAKSNEYKALSGCFLACEFSRQIGTSYENA